MLNSTRVKKVLGISVGDRGMQIAEVSCQGNIPQVLRLAEFPYPAGTSLEQPGTLGITLGEFLRAQQFSARTVVMGVPAKWLLLKAQNLPPADPQTAANILWLQAESCNTPEVGEMAFDYLGEPSPNYPRSIMLLGLARRRIDRLSSVARAAELKVLKIVPTAVSLAAATRSTPALVLSVRPEAVELVGCDGSGVQLFRHISGATGAGAWGAELRRAVAAINGTNSKNEQPDVVLWDDVGLDANAALAMESAIGKPPTRGTAALLGVSTANPSDRIAGASAIALALEAIREGRCSSDVLHPRLKAADPIRRHRPVMWISVAAAALLIALLAGYVDISRIEKDLATVDANLQTMEPKVKVAGPFVANMRFARDFQGGKANYLTCMREVTSAMPTDGQTYLTAFHLHFNGDSAMKGEFSGKSASEQDVLALIDKLSNSGHFGDVKRRMDAHEQKAGAPEVSFDVTFEYRPKL